MGLYILYSVMNSGQKLCFDQASQLRVIHIDFPDETMQCSVCMEEFKLDEKVRKLPCNHHYHTDCIVPWLEMVSVHYIIWFTLQETLLRVKNRTKEPCDKDHVRE